MMRPRDLGEYRYLGVRADGWLVVVTAEIIDGTNVFEIRPCASCSAMSVRPHDAEAWRLERLAREVRP